MKISEIFESLEGEAGHAGEPAVFVRVSKCNFALEGHPCPFCDTSYSWSGGSDMSLTEIVDRIYKVKSRYTESVTITGGEPLIHDEIYNLIKLIKTNGFKVRVETNGSIPIKQNMGVDCWSLDIKTPCSGNSEHNYYPNLYRLRSRDQVKFIVKDDVDLEFVKNALDEYSTLAKIYLQPVWGECDLGWLWEKVKEIPGAIFSLQLNKVVGGKR